MTDRRERSQEPSDPAQQDAREEIVHWPPRSQNSEPVVFKVRLTATLQDWYWSEDCVIIRAFIAFAGLSPSMSAPIGPAISWALCLLIALAASECSSADSSSAAALNLNTRELLEVAQSPPPPPPPPPPPDAGSAGASSMAATDGTPPAPTAPSVQTGSGEYLSRHLQRGPVGPGQTCESTTLVSQLHLHAQLECPGL